MKQKQMKACAFLMFLFGLSAVHAQQAIISSGGKAIGVNGSVNYSLGQTIYTTNRNSEGSVSQGVLQSFEISVQTGIDVKSILLECSAYPNPTTDFLRLKLKDINSANLSFQLFDINGIQIISKKVEGSDIEISLQGQKSGTYFLKVLQLKGTSNQREIKVFKIIKN